MSNEFKRVQTDLDLDSIVDELDTVINLQDGKRAGRPPKSKEEREVSRLAREQTDPRLVTRFVIPSSGLVPLETKLPSSDRMKTDLRRREVYRLRLKENMNLNEIREEILSRGDEFTDNGRYTLAMARNDLTSGIRLITTEIKELAKVYFQIELDKLDAIDAKSIEHLETIDYKLNYLMSLEEMDILYVEMVSKLISSRNRLVENLFKSMERRTKYLGMDMPTKTEVAQTTMNISLDDFLNARQQFISENDVVDGSVRYLDEPTDEVD